MGRNKVLVIDIDDSRDPYHIYIQHATRTGDDLRATDEGHDVVSDMATLCEALCTLIHAAEQEGIKPSHVSLKDCIHHLEQGTFDPNYICEINKPTPK